MMMRKTILAMFVGLSVVMSGQSVAQETGKTPLEEYQDEVTFSLKKCKLFFDLNREGIGKKPRTGLAAYAVCINEQEPEIKKTFRAALPSVRGKQAKEALKDHYIAALSALKGIHPGMNELLTTYDQRRQSLNDKVSEAWTRFEVENE
jgi:hypothetical protein